MTNFTKHGLRLSALSAVFLISSALYFPFTDVEKETDQYSFANPPMCAPSTVFQFEQPAEGVALAPVLNYNWDHNFPVTTNSKEAQKFFNQGLFFTFAFNHAEAERAFREAARLDPSCAMAHWGIALSLGPNINRPMQKSVMADAYAESQKAMRLRTGCTAKEQAMIEAMALRYAKSPPNNRQALDKAYADAMRLVAHQYREDVDILALFAESLMDTTPWNYWNKDGTPKYVTKEIHRTLEYIIAKSPDHPGANHYYIHAMEEFEPAKAEASADHLTKSKYVSGHLVHMPSHIYVRLGRYEDANTANVGGIALDEDYIEQCQAQGYYPALYYPHNVHFLWFGASMSGQKALATDAAEKTAIKGAGQRFQVIPLYSMLRFGEWDKILLQKTPDNNHPYSKVLWQYAQGMAYAKTGKETEAKVALKRVRKLLKSKAMKRLPQGFMPFQDLSKVCELSLAAELAGINEEAGEKVNLLAEAVQLQDGFRYSEPPFYYMEMRQALGAALLEADRPAEAEKVYRTELARFPNNGWSLYGLQESLEKQGKSAEAKQTKAEFDRAWAKADVDITSSVF